jgi:hypothetical protein
VLGFFQIVPGWPATSHLRRLGCERVVMAAGAFREADSLDRAFDATLDRLGNAKDEASWWRKLVLTAEGDYVLPYNGFDPHFLRIPSVRDWLSNGYVRADLKTLATEKILASGRNTDITRERLACSYARYTAEDPGLAAGTIDVVVNGLVAGILSALSPSQRIVADLMRENSRRINAASAELLRAVLRLEQSVSPRLAQSDNRLESGAVVTPPTKAPEPIQLSH